LSDENETGGPDSLLSYFRMTDRFFIPSFLSETAEKTHSAQ